MRDSDALMPLLAALAGVALLALMDAFMKGASLAVGAYSAALLRSAFGTLLIAPVWLARGGRWPGREALRLHVLRGVVSGFMALTFFYALTKLPIAETIAISFVAPLIALYLAKVLLGERIRHAAVLGSIVGFAGTLVIVGGRLGRSDLDSEVLLGLGSILISALLYAYNFIVIRKQSQIAGPVEIAVFHSGVAACLLGLAAPWFLALPTGETAAHILAAALLTVLGALAIAYAYARAEAQVLVPLEYSGFLWACLFGWLFFGEDVTATTLIGTALVVGGCWIATRKPRQF